MQILLHTSCVILGKSLNLSEPLWPILHWSNTLLTCRHLFINTHSWFALVMESEVTQSCPTLCDPMDYSLPGSSVHGIFQARVLERVAISFSRGSSQLRDRTLVSRIAGRHFNLWATREALTLTLELSSSGHGFKYQPYSDDPQIHTFCVGVFWELLTCW